MDTAFLIVMILIFLCAMYETVWILCKKEANLKPEYYEVTAVSEMGTRPDQQDALWFSGMQDIQSCAKIYDEDACLAVVADGMGGLKNGGMISHIIAEEMKNAFFSSDRPEEPVAFLQNALWKINKSVEQYLSEHGNENGGSTIVAAYIHEGSLYFLSVGDSRIYLVHHGRIQQLNIEHTFGNDLDDLAMRGLISEEEAKNNPQRGALTSYVGMEEIKKIDGNIKPISLEKGDVVLLMSDGVYRSVDEDKLLAYAEEKDCRRITMGIKEEVMFRHKSKQDNYSVIAIRVL